MDVGQLFDSVQSFEHFPIGAFMQCMGDFDVAIKVVFNRAFPPARDDQDVFNTRVDEFLNDVLNRRFVNNGHHLFGQGFGGGQHATAVPGCGNDCFPNFQHDLQYRDLSNDLDDKFQIARKKCQGYFPILCCFALLDFIFISIYYSVSSPLLLIFPLFRSLLLAIIQHFSSFFSPILPDFCSLYRFRWEILQLWLFGFQTCFPMIRY